MTINKELIKKYNQPIPRYTSYPPANHFQNDLDRDSYLAVLKESNHSTNENLAFYFHIPFCEQICYYCGCNAQKLHKNSRIEDYVTALLKEIDLVTEHLDKQRKISQIHFGGGTPNAIDLNYLKIIITKLSSLFKFIDKPEIAIECHPALLDFEAVDALIDAGFNRLSLGIQDFDEAVLKAVNRKPSKLAVEELVTYIRNKDKHIAINLDFIYGLPLQSPDRFAKSIERAISIKPDRLVTFSYAHVPWLKKHQSILEKKGLPDPDSKMAMFEKASQLLQAANYQAIGFDHFAQANDELSIALSNKQLHRNFQGYCTRRTTGEVYAFGVTGISQLDKAYAQNTKSIEKYISSIEKGELAIEKGLLLKPQQMIVREVINQIMCNHYIHWETLATRLKISAQELKEIIGYDEKKLAPLAEDRLISFDEKELQATDIGRVLIRNIAAVFDPLYAQSQNRYSQTV